MELVEAALARDGVRLTDNYASSPVCSPTRAAFLTGRYQQRAGIDLDVEALGRLGVELALFQLPPPPLLPALLAPRGGVAEGLAGLEFGVNTSILTYYFVQISETQYDMVSAKDGKTWISWFF